MSLGRPYRCHLISVDGFVHGLGWCWQAINLSSGLTHHQLVEPLATPGTYTAAHSTRYKWRHQILFHPKLQCVAKRVNSQNHVRGCTCAVERLPLFGFNLVPFTPHDTTDTKRQAAWNMLSIKPYSKRITEPTGYRYMPVARCNYLPKFKSRHTSSTFHSRCAHHKARW